MTELSVTYFGCNGCLHFRNNLGTVLIDIIFEDNPKDKNQGMGSWSSKYEAIQHHTSY